MSARERHKKKVVQRLGQKLESLKEQEAQLHDVITNYVAKAEGDTASLLEIEDSASFLQQYGRVEQFLDRVNNVCELLTASAEDMIENVEYDGASPMDDTVMTIPQTNLSMVIPPVTITKSKDEQMKEELKGILEKAQSSKISSPVEKDHHKIKVPKTESVCDEIINLPEKQKNVVVTDVSDSDTNMDIKDSDIKFNLRMPYIDSMTNTRGSVRNIERKQETFNRRVPRASSPKNLKMFKQEKEVVPSQEDENVMSYFVEKFKEGIPEGSLPDHNRQCISETEPLQLDQSSKSKQLNQSSEGKQLNQSTESKQLNQSSESKQLKQSSESKQLDQSTEGKQLNQSSESKQSLAPGKINQDKTSGCVAKGCNSAERLYMTPVVVTEVVSPWCFFVQRQGPQMKELMESICMYIQSSGFDTKPPMDVTVGSLCLARYSVDRAFYRAYVKKVYTSTPGLVSHVDVLYVDYGNQEKVPIQSLRTIPDLFCVQPYQAYCCALAEVMPKNKYNLWTEEGIIRFRQFVTGQILTCTQVVDPDATWESADPTEPRSQTKALPWLVQLTGNFQMPTMGPCLYMNQFHIGQLLITTGQATSVELSKQIQLLMLSGEGFEESEILNNSLEDKGSKLKCEGHQGQPALEVSKDHVGQGQNVHKSDVPKNDLSAIEDEKKDLMKTKANEQERSKTSGQSCLEKKSSEQINNKDSETDRNKDIKKKQESQCVTVRSTSNNEVIVSEKSAIHMNSSWEDEAVNGVEEGFLELSEDHTKFKVLADSVVNDNNDVQKTEVASVDVMTSLNGKVVAKDDKKPSDKDLIKSSKGKKKRKTRGKVEKLSDIEVTEPLSSTGSEISLDKKEDFPDTTESSESSTETTMKLGDLDLKSVTSQGQKVMLACIRSPSHFYIHLVTDQVGETLNQLMKNLNKVFEHMNRRKLSRLSQEFVPSVGQLCCARFKEDNKFYRAKILSCENTNIDLSHTSKVCVHYIDFGDEECLPRTCLWPLPSEYTSIPPLAVRCSLAYVKPADGSDTWKKSSTDMLIKIAGIEKTLDMHIVHGTLPQFAVSEKPADQSATFEDRDPLRVLLVDKSGSEEVCFNMELINLGVAILDPGRSIKPGNQSVPWEGQDSGVMDPALSLDDWNPMQQDFLSLRNSYNIDVDDVGVATVGYKYDEDKVVCKFFSRGKRCWRGENCPFKHIKPESGVRMDKDQVYALVGDLEMMPAINSWVAVEVATILSPSHFYIHLPMGNKSLDMSSDSGTGEEAVPEERLEDLHKAINQSYAYRSVRDSKLTLRAPGEIVAARFSHDEQWYRARVIEVAEDKAKVFFLDYGNTEWLEDWALADIKPEFLHLPFQALECFLCNVKQKEGDTWSEDAKTFFREMVDGKTLVGHTKFMSLNGILWMDLFDTSQKLDINIGALLIEHGYGIRTGFPPDFLCGGTSESGSSRRSSVSEINYIPG